MLKPCLSLVIVFLFSLNAFSQQQASPDTTKSDVFTKVDKEAEFPGGKRGYLSYVTRNLDMRVADSYFRSSNIKSETVHLEFIVDANGKVSDIRATNHDSLYPRIVKETIRLIKRSPDWIPATLNNTNVKSLKKLSITWTAPVNL